MHEHFEWDDIRTGHHEMNPEKPATVEDITRLVMEVGPFMAPQLLRAGHQAAHRFAAVKRADLSWEEWWWQPWAWRRVRRERAEVDREEAAYCEEAQRQQALASTVIDAIFAHLRDGGSIETFRGE